MSVWNYRVVRDTDGGFAVHECYYDDDGAITGITEKSVAPYGDTYEELEHEVADFYMRAFHHPPIDCSTMKEVIDA